MKFIETTVHFLLIFLPGIICYFIIDHLTTHKERKGYEVFLHAFVYGILCYLILFLLQNILFTAKFGDIPFNIMQPSDKSTQLLPLSAVYATLIALPVSIIFTFSYRYQWLLRLARRIKASNKCGYISIWDRFFNSSGVGWVVYRDIKNDLMYDGWVKAFSDDADENEIILREVCVYRNSTSKHLYDLEAVYLARSKNDISIEIRGNKKTVTDNNSNNKSITTTKNEEV